MPLTADFPNLSDVQSKKTSETDYRYNCIAWAFKDNRRHWWPNQRRSYWPLNPVGKTTMEAFEELFKELGWEETNKFHVERGLEKIAFYAKDGEPTHAARLLNNGQWTSKLGRNIDLSHQLHELEGPTYGKVIRIYCRHV